MPAIPRRYEEARPDSSRSTAAEAPLVLFTSSVWCPLARLAGGPGECASAEEG